MYITLTINGVEFVFRYCPAGTFKMGSPENEEGRDSDETLHEVTITRGYWILVTPVTQKMYEAVTGKNPSAFSATGEYAKEVAGLDTSDFPVEMVSWYDANAFCKVLNEKIVPEWFGNLADANALGEALNELNVVPEELEFRLPTEAEWERACRAGTETPFPWGSTLNGGEANCNGKLPYGGANPGPYLGRPSAVGAYGANALGLIDMCGNVWEWCADRYREAYDTASSIDPTGPTTGDERVMRGPGWCSPARNCRAAKRCNEDPKSRYRYSGFRVVLANKLS
ncbi:MAG: formylglycine-generating enzyme family protein [Thermoguttaceae bacterium]|nr:formylglycine-generating enzyme family protein [Thermoguttaceae bacterium]